MSESENGSAAVLEVRGVQVSYGATPVLHNVSLVVPRGAVVAVLGPNGAGKSTLLKAVCGLARVTRGSVTLLGHDVTRGRTSSIVRAGIGYVPQGRRLFPFMTAEENLRIGAYNRTDRTVVRSSLDELYDRWPLLARVKNRPGGQLSGGEQQMVALGRALMADPALLLLDEPSLGLAPVLATELYREVRSLVAERRQSVLLVEQNVGLALGLATYVYVLTRGRITGEGPPSSMTAHEVAALYFRTATEDAAPAAQGGEPSSLSSNS